MLQPATPVPTTVKSRARARLVELHELHGWNKDSPISISKPKSDSKERQREAGAKRMRNMGFYEVAAECGYSTAAALREELEHRKTTAPGLAEIKKKAGEMEARYGKLIAAAAKTQQEADAELERATEKLEHDVGRSEMLRGRVRCARSDITRQCDGTTRWKRRWNKSGRRWTRSWRRKTRS